MESTALVPLGVYQHCAMASVAYVEHRRTNGQESGGAGLCKSLFQSING